MAENLEALDFKMAEDDMKHLYGFGKKWNFVDVEDSLELILWLKNYYLIIIII